MRSFSKEQFIALFSALRMFVTVKLSLPHNSGFADVAPVVQVLAILFSVNERRGHVEYSEFYNDGVNSPETVSLKADFDKWKNSQRSMNTSDKLLTYANFCVDIPYLYIFLSHL